MQDRDGRAIIGVGGGESPMSPVDRRGSTDLGAVYSETGTHGVRREARCRIPGAARRNSEECSWVTQLTWRRKPKGTIACWESGGGPKTL